MIHFKYIVAVAVAFLAGAFPALAQEDVWNRVKEVNFPKDHLEARWHRTYCSPMLQEPVESEGTVSIRQPDYLRWETLKPVPRVTELDGNRPKGRFRMPSEKDFRVQILESDVYSIRLTPIRRDLKQMLSQVVLRVDKKTFELQDITILGTDGDHTVIDFKDIKKQ